MSALDKAWDRLAKWAEKDSSVSKWQPEVTADGDKIVLYLPSGDETVRLSPQEAFALQCQISAAYQEVVKRLYEAGEAALHINTAGELQCVPIEPEPETWRDREPML